MKDKKFRKQILIFLIIITIINALFTVGWFFLKATPILGQINVFEETISLELRKEYDSIDELVVNLEKISRSKGITFRIEDVNRRIIVKEPKRGIIFFSDITNVNNKTYLISFISDTKLDISDLVFQSCLFQVLEVTILLIVTFMLSRNKIIKPTEKIINDIRNYKFGQKPKRREVNNELDLIQNEFVNLTDELEREKKEQKRIIASISHDIKTPLTSIIGYADLIKDEKNIKNIKEYNDKIADKALHLKEILATFDDYLLNYEKVPLSLSEISIKELITELNNDYKIELENNGIKFQVISKLNKDIIELDKLKIKRVFSNLIANCIRYLPEKGKIIIKITKNDRYYNFIISDNGPGIKDDVINKIFDPFYTTDKSRKISGLGLSICKEFVEMHGGNIKAYNKKGLTIEFNIPIKKN